LIWIYLFKSQKSGGQGLPPTRDNPAFCA